MGANSDYIYTSDNGFKIDLRHDPDMYYSFIQSDKEKEDSENIISKHNIRNKFQELNEKYFNNKLEMPLIEIKNLSEYDRLGQCFGNRIELHTKLFINDSGLKQNNFWNDVLLHEMIHYSINEKSNLKEIHEQSNPHLEKSWKTEVKRISKLLKVEFKESKSYLEAFPVKARPRNYYEDGIKLISKKKVSK